MTDLELLEKLAPGLPLAVTVALYFILKHWSDLKNAVSRLYSDRNTSLSREREANETIKLSRADVELQSQITRESREWAEQSAAHALARDLIREMLDWAKTDFSSMQAKIDRLEEAVEKLERSQVVSSKELSAKLTGQFAILSKIDDQLRHK